MGIYLNPDIELFSMSVASDIYVDKTGLIDFVNRFIGKERPYLASSRPRRFGKTMAAKMLASYYNRAYHSKVLFNELNISHLSSFEKHLNKYDVIFMDLRWMYGDALARKKLIPFSTHAGSGLSGFNSKLSAACPNSTVGTGLAIAGTDVQNNQDSVRESVNSWLSGFGY